MLIYDCTLDSSLIFLFKSHFNRCSPLSSLSVCPIQGLHRPDREPHPEHGPARQRCPGWDPWPVPLLHEDPRDQAVASATSLHASWPTPPNPDMRSREDKCFGVGGYLNFTPKILPFHKSRSLGLVFLDHDGHSRVQEAACRARRVSPLRTGKANESLFTSTVEHSFYCLEFLFFRLGNLDRLLREFWKKAVKNWSADERKGRRNEVQLLGNMWRECLQTKQRNHLILNEPFL